MRSRAMRYRADRRVLQPAAALMVLIAWGAGCADQATEWAGTVRDSAGVKLVTNPSEGLWGETQRPTVRDVGRIGGSEAEHAVFGYISDIAVRDDGHVFVLDRQAQLVQQYGADGSWVRTVGRPGRGPGELSDGTDALWVGDGDTLFVADVGAQRVTRYTPEGQPAGGLSIPFSAGIAYEWRADTTGRVVHALVVFGARGADAQLIVARDAAGQVSDTLIRLPAMDPVAMEPSGPVLTIFAPAISWDVDSDGGLVSAISDEYRISRYDRGGRLLMEFTYPSEDRALTLADQALYRDAALRLWEGRMPANMRAALRENARFAKTYPAFAGVKAGPHGTTWVQRFRHAGDFSTTERQVFDAERDVGSPTWEVFDAHGRFLGPIDLPVRFTPLQFVGPRIYGVVRDTLDVQSVLILEVENFDAPI